MREGWPYPSVSTQPYSDTYLLLNQPLWAVRSKAPIQQFYLLIRSIFRDILTSCRSIAEKKGLTGWLVNIIVYWVEGWVV